MGGVRVNKRVFVWAAVVAAVATVALPLVSVPSAQALRADANDFTFGEFVGDYTLSMDEEARSSLHVVETFTAEFPDHDQNKGVVRAIPLNYDGHPVSVRVESLTRNGAPEPIYDQERSGGYLHVSTGDDDYVRGDQTYKLTYTLRDVTIDHGEHQEFYWDTIGTQSSQPFAGVTAHVHLDASVADLYEGEALCFEGGHGSDTPCGVEQGAASVTFESNGALGPRLNVTMVMRFEAGAFAPYETPWYIDLAHRYGTALSILLSLGGTAWVTLVRVRRGRNAPGRGVVVAQYEPPSGISVLMAGAILRSRRSVLPAQFLDFAVRGKARLLETVSKKGKPSYRLEYLDTEGLLPEEYEVLKSLGSPAPGTKAKLTDISTGTAEKLRTATHAVSKSQVYDEGYRRKVPGSKGLLIYSIFALAVSVGLFVVGILIEFLPLLLSFVLAIVVFSLALVLNYSMTPLTRKGAEVREHLEGLRSYIRLAEKDRIRMLQSPEGAERAPINTDDHAQLVKLYERVLPYAVLLGLEKEWSRVLASEYELVGQPDWYSGHSALNVIGITAMVHSFSTSTTAAFAPPSSSSSSGMSGGFSGGGGGGGGFGGR